MGPHRIHEEPRPRRRRGPRCWPTSRRWRCASRCCTPPTPTSSPSPTSNCRRRARGAVAPLARQLEEAIDAATGTADETARTLYANVVLGSIVHDLALTRHLGLPLAEVDHAAHATGPGFPGPVVALGRTAQGVPWSLHGWHFAADLPGTARRSHSTTKGTIEAQLRDALRPQRSDRPQPHQRRRLAAPLRTGPAWPRRRRPSNARTPGLVSLTPSPFRPYDLLAARRDLNNAQALWRACADTTGIMGDPSAESSGNIERNPS